MRRAALLLVLLLLPTRAASAGDEVVINRLGGDIRVRDAPAGATLRTLGGDIHVSRAGGEVFAKTIGGEIEIDSLAGSLRARTLGGDISVRAVGTGKGRSLYLRSIGGSVELLLPRGFSAEFEVEVEQKRSDDYRIHSDIPLQMDEWNNWTFFQRHRVVSGKGKSGNGDNRVVIEATGGDVRIRYE